MLHNINEAVEFFSQFSNLKRIPQKSQKDCYQAIIDCLNFFHTPRDMDYWKPTTIETAKRSASNKTARDPLLSLKIFL